MSRMHALSTAAMLCWTGCSSAIAQVALSRPYLVAASGQSVEVARYAGVNPDCSSIGHIAVNLTVAPRDGEIRVGEGRSYMAYAPGNPRSAYNRRKIPTTFVFYRSQPGFVGQDSFVVEVVFPIGAAQRARLAANVR